MLKLNWSTWRVYFWLIQKYWWIVKRFLLVSKLGLNQDWKLFLVSELDLNRIEDILLFMYCETNQKINVLCFSNKTWIRWIPKWIFIIQIHFFLFISCKMLVLIFLASQHKIYSFRSNPNNTDKFYLFPSFELSNGRISTYSNISKIVIR